MKKSNMQMTMQPGKTDASITQSIVVQFFFFMAHFNLYDEIFRMICYTARLGAVFEKSYIAKAVFP